MVRSFRAAPLACLLASFAAACGASPTAKPAAPPALEAVAAPAASEPAERAPTAPSEAVAGELDLAPALAPPPIPPGTAVLHIGDSFALAGFAQGLKPHMKALRTRYEVRSETSSYTNGWAAKLEKIVADTQPDLVIINLGANEVANTDPPAHAPAVRKIVRAIGDRPCVWVAPPLWRKDTGITEVIRENSAPCRFYDSTALVKKPIPRQGDRIHPNEEGGAIWADAFWSWLNEQRAGAAAEGALEGKLRPWRLKVAPIEEHTPGAAAATAKNAGDAPAP